MLRTQPTPQRSNMAYYESMIKEIHELDSRLQAFVHSSSKPISTIFSISDRCSALIKEFKKKAICPFPGIAFEAAEALTSLQSRVNKVVHDVAHFDKEQFQLEDLFQSMPDY